MRETSKPDLVGPRLTATEIRRRIAEEDISNAILSPLIDEIYKIVAERQSTRTPVASEETRGRTMTKEQYLKALKKLGLTPASKATSQALGLSVRQCQRLSGGDQEIPETVAKLLKMYLEHGLPE